MNLIRYQPPDDAPKAIIVDIDGTVAKHVLPDGVLLRGHHEYHRVGEDLPNQPVIDTVLALRDAGHRLVFCSGRPAVDRRGFNVRTATREWLLQHLDARAAEAPLFMRSPGDMRPDDIVKRELFDAHIRHRYAVTAAFDDRPRVIRLWLALGIHTFDVAPESGEF